MSKLQNIPFPLLKFISRIASHFPRQILSFRYYRWTKTKLDWKHPRDLQSYIFSKLIISKYTGEIHVWAELADKIRVRDYVTNRAGEKYLTKLYGIWDDPKDVTFSTLPNSFVLKTNNGCGTNIIIRNGTNKEGEKEDIINSLKKWLRFPYGALTGQSHYSLIVPKVLAEEYLEQGGNNNLPYDYKFFCFKGEPKFILYYEGREVNGHLANNMVFDLHWNAMPDIVLNPTTHQIPRPRSLDEMIVVVKKLCRGFDFVRVDLYEINGKPIFGEMTFTPDVLTYFDKSFLDLSNYPELC